MSSLPRIRRWVSRTCLFKLFSPVEYLCWWHPVMSRDSSPSSHQARRWSSHVSRGRHSWHPHPPLVGHDLLLVGWLGLLLLLLLLQMLLLLLLLLSCSGSWHVDWLPRRGVLCGFEIPIGVLVTATAEHLTHPACWGAGNGVTEEED